MFTNRRIAAEISGKAVVLTTGGFSADKVR